MIYDILTKVDRKEMHIMNYREIAICDVCGKEIKMPTGRLEWGYAPGEAHVCHHTCSYACTNPAMMSKDIELDSNIIPPAYVYDLIFATAEEGEYSIERAREIAANLFGENVTK